eukprot:8653645-Karenia_brevis.AAC.1
MSGELLPRSLVRAARKQEVEFPKKFPVYEKVPEAMSKGKQTISTRSCYVKKGDDLNLAVRARLCGREFKWQDPFMQGTFAATPPSEALRYLLSWAMTKRRRRG